MKISVFFLSEHFQFLEVKFSIYLNWRVFGMWAFVISYVTFVVSLFVPHRSFLWCLGRAVFRDWGIFWISSLIFCLYKSGCKDVSKRNRTRNG